ncbi:aminopeptidase [bacterium]|nr:aminopeptidase [bacterium]
MSNSLTRYASLLAASVNVQPGQLVVVRCETEYYDLALLAAEAAYQRGASMVRILTSDPRQTEQTVRHASEDEIRRMFDTDIDVFNRLADCHGALIGVRGEQDFNLGSRLQAEVPDRYQLYMNTLTAAREPYSRLIVNRAQGQWLVAGAATESWAKQIGITKDELWERIFRVTFADQENCLELNAQSDAALLHRRNILNELGYRRFRVTGGGSDFTVGIHPLARWMGGGRVSQRGVPFTPNKPTYENFITPDWRTANGTLKMHRPFMVEGVPVIGLVVTYKDGEIVEWDAESGKEAFAQLIAREGAGRGGEFALADRNTPVYLENMIWWHILFDENAACHWAFGNGYSAAFEDGASLTAAELAERGLAQAKTHVDGMWGCDQTCVFGFDASGTEHPIMLDGAWAPELANPAGA